MLKYETIIIKDGEPCDHIGCANHRTHACEGCGRIQCKGAVHKKILAGGMIAPKKYGLLKNMRGKDNVR